MHRSTVLTLLLLASQHAAVLTWKRAPCFLRDLSACCVADRCNHPATACQECIASSGDVRRCEQCMAVCQNSTCWKTCTVHDDCLTHFHLLDMEEHQQSRREELTKLNPAEDRREIDRTNWTSPRLHMSQAASADALFKNYAAMHRQASAEPISSQRSYWVWHAGREGLGNRLRSLLSFLFVALVMEKILYIVWDEPVHHSHLFSFSLDLDAAPHLDRLNAHFGKANMGLCIPCTPSALECTNPELVPVHTVLGEFWSSQYVKGGVAPQVQSCDDILLPLFRGLPLAFREIWFDDDPNTAKRMIMEYFLIASEGVTALMAPVLAAMDSAKLGIGLHIRMGTKHTSAVLMATQRDIDTYHKCLGYLIRTRFNGEAAIHQVKIFLATDDPAVHAEFKELYGDSLLSVEGPIVHSGKEHGGLDEHNQLPTMLAHQKVVADWYVLALSEVMLGSFSSSFSWMAGHFRSPDAPPLLMPDDWDESAPFGGKCDALNFNVRSRAQQAHVLADRVPDGQ